MKDSAFKLCPARKRVIGSLKMLDFALLPAYNRHIEKALPIDGQPSKSNEVITELVGTGYGGYFFFACMYRDMMPMIIMQIM